MVVLANLYVPADEAALAVTNLALGLPLDTAMGPVPLAATAPPPAGALAGTYRSGEGHDFTFVEAEGHLAARSGYTTSKVEFKADGTAEFTDGRGNKRTARFMLEESGRAWALFIGLRVVRRVV